MRPAPEFPPEMNPHQVFHATAKPELRGGGGVGSEKKRRSQEEQRITDRVEGGIRVFRQESRSDQKAALDLSPFMALIPKRIRITAMLCEEGEE